MAKSNKNKLSSEEIAELLMVLEARFKKNMNRHKGIDWVKVQTRLKASQDKMWSLNAMEASGGEPDVVGEGKNGYIFYDCSPESPAGRRSLCYDRDAWESRKEHRPKSNAVDMAAAMGIEILSEEEYFQLQKLGKFDAKTSSWLNTPAEVRELGGAISGEFRFGRVFIYANGAESYFAARGFRGSLRV